MPGLFVFSYVEFGCYPWKTCYFLKGNGGKRESGGERTWKETGGGGGSVVWIYYIRERN